MRPTAPCNMDRKHRKMALRNCALIQLLRFRSELPRPLGSTSVNVHLLIVGRLGLDSGTLGLKETFHRLFCVGLVAHVVYFQEIVLF